MLFCVGKTAFKRIIIINDIIKNIQYITHKKRDKNYPKLIT